MVGFLRVCIGCGDEKKFNNKRDASAELCRKGSNTGRRGVPNLKARKSEDNKVKHFRTCIDCGDVRKVGSAKLARNKRCGPCSVKKKFNIPDGGYKRVCGICGDSKDVASKQLASYTTCTTCYSSLIVKTRNVMSAGIPKPRKKKKEASLSVLPSKTKTMKPMPISEPISTVSRSKQKELDDEMIAKFLKSKEPSVKFSDYVPL